MDAIGRSTVHWAARYNSPDVLEFLVVDGESVNLSTDFKETPLHWAATHNSLAAARQLLKWHADKNLKNKRGHTPLDIACLHDYSEMQQLLQ